MLAGQPTAIMPLFPSSKQDDTVAERRSSAPAAATIPPLTASSACRASPSPTLPPSRTTSSWSTTRAAWRPSAWCAWTCPTTAPPCCATPRAPRSTPSAPVRGGLGRVVWGASVVVPAGQGAGQPASLPAQLASTCPRASRARRRLVSGGAGGADARGRGAPAHQAQPRARPALRCGTLQRALVVAGRALARLLPSTALRTAPDTAPTAAPAPPLPPLRLAPPQAGTFFQVYQHNKWVARKKKEAEARAAAEAAAASATATAAATPAR